MRQGLDAKETFNVCNTLSISTSDPSTSFSSVLPCNSRHTNLAFVFTHNFAGHLLSGSGTLLRNQASFEECSVVFRFILTAVVKCIPDMFSHRKVTVPVSRCHIAVFLPVCFVTNLFPLIPLSYQRVSVVSVWCLERVFDWCVYRPISPMHRNFRDLATNDVVDTGGICYRLSRSSRLVLEVPANKTSAQMLR